MSSVTLPSGITLEYETAGDPTDPALLLVMGFTAQMTDWPEGFFKQLTSLGRYVIRFDNRDCGLSTKFDGQSADMNAVLGALMSGDNSTVGPVPYSLSDMAADGIGLLDALGIEKADIVGASMGGMIVQTMAIEYPERVRTLTSIMSTTGEVEFGGSSPAAITALLTPSPSERSAYIENAKNWKVWQSKKYSSDEANATRAAFNFDRSFYPEGSSRQLAAIVASGSRADALRTLDVPTLVIHGVDDELIMPSGGERTAALIPGARLLMVTDMGHDVPEPLWDEIVGAIGELISSR